MAQRIIIDRNGREWRFNTAGGGVWMWEGVKEPDLKTSSLKCAAELAIGYLRVCRLSTREGAQIKVDQAIDILLRAIESAPPGREV